jgi:serine O-acetyltransferase
VRYAGKYQGLVRVSSVALASLRADIARYKQDSWLIGPWYISERTIWFVVAYRLGQRLLEIRSPLLKRILLFPYSLIFTFVQALTNIEVWPNAQIGPGLRIYHGGNIVINSGAVIGSNVILRQGVTIGARTAGGTLFPVIGDGVEFGAYAQVYGAVTVGADAKIGAMSVVLNDVAAGAVVAGAPARVIRAAA